MKKRFEILHGHKDGWFIVVRLWDGIVLERFSNRREAEIFVAGLMWRYGPRKAKPERYGVFHGKKDPADCGRVPKEIQQ